MRVGGMHDDAGWLVDRQQGLVLKQNLEGCGRRQHRLADGFGGWGGEDRDDVADSDSAGGFVDRPAVDRDGAVRDPALHSCARGLGQPRKMSLDHVIDPAPSIPPIGHERAYRHSAMIIRLGDCELAACDLATGG